MSNEQPGPIRAAFSAVIDGPREVWKRLVNRVRGVKDIDVHEAHDWLANRGAFLLDVREQDEYDAAHLAGTTLIPLGALIDRIAELEPHRDRPIVIICRGGRRSATACWQLAQHGFGQTLNVAGGIIAWKKAALPLAG